MRFSSIKFIYYPFLGLLYFTFLVVAIEAGFRITNTSGVGFLQYDDKVIWRMNANEFEEKQVDGKTFRISFNARGFRDRDHDLEKDPDEMANLSGAPEMKTVEKALRASLMEWRKRGGEK